MKLQTIKVSEIARISIIIVLILNFFIIFLEIRYIEYIYLIIFLLYHFFIEITVKKHYENSYNKLRKIIKIKRNFFSVINILIFFYIFKEPYFFLSKYKVLILFVSVLIGYSSLVFIQRIKIRFKLAFFKEIIKIFFISGIIYYFPIVCIHVFWLFDK